MERMVLSLGRVLARRENYQPVIACLAHAGQLAGQARDAGIAVLDRLLHHKFDFLAIRRLRRLFAGEGLSAPPAAVVIVNPGGDRMFWASLARGRHGRRPPLVLWTQRTPLPGHRLLEPVNRLLVSRLDAIAVLGPRQAEAYAALEHLPADRMHIVPNALETVRMDELAGRASDGTRANIRGHFGVGDDEVVVLCVANVRPIKRVDLFCRAGSLLTGRRLRFWLVGDAPGGTGQVNALLGQYDLSAPGFQWLGPRTDVDRLAAASDIAVCCSDSEGQSVWMLEAMAAGVPFVSTAVGEHPTVIEHEKTGLLVQPGSADELAGAIRQLADDAALRCRLADAAGRIVRERHSMERSADAFEQMILRVRP